MVALAATALTLAPVGVRPAAAIAHGEDAADGAYRFSVRLTMVDLPVAGGGTRDSWCSGALVAPRWVITAGHCFRSPGGQRVSRVVARRTLVTVGRTTLDSRAGHQAEAIAVRQSDAADVALVELGTPITGVAPLRIGDTPPVPGEVVRLTGYGLTTADGPAPADRLQTGQFTVGRVGADVIETSGRRPRADTSPCPHDSGGPYFRERADGTAVLVAVVSTGPGCPHPGPDFSARTDTLRDWITDTTDPANRPSRWVPVGVGAVLALLLLPVALVTRRRRRTAPVPARAGRGVDRVGRRPGRVR
ncbi:MULTISPECIES: trypsin-like serine protease [unclassified Micromonospora]|uniref:S1 family peptidase n=1 Tax=unclassified Micromonospora TaxID=2617518 RepID=UPI001C5EE451|nr:trypsin-like serine protease [Micromonospora sp. RL09-050-HVF-A]MBW4700559.1 trypsin-like serine protease [Micromonospora sp. RL09-050-HVF-A]